MATDPKVDPKAELEKRRKEAEEALLLLVLLWAEGVQPFQALAPDIAATIRDGYATAYGLGRNLAGDEVLRRAEDAQAGTLLWSQEAARFERLRVDVVSGRYGVPGSEESPPLPKGLNNRLRGYLKKWRAAANAAWVASLPDGTELDWILGYPETVHCEDCPKWAKAGPYTADTLPALPGDGRSMCSVGCLCKLRVHDAEDEGF